MGTKLCKKCNQDKPITEFLEARNRQTSNVCRECYNERRRLTRKKRPKIVEVFKPSTKPENAVLPPYFKPLYEREVYVPPRWGR